MHFANVKLSQSLLPLETTVVRLDKHQCYEWKLNGLHHQSDLFQLPHSNGFSTSIIIVLSRFGFWSVWSPATQIQVVFGLVDLGGQVRRSPSIGMVQQHDPFVGILDPIMWRWRTHPCGGTKERTITLAWMNRLQRILDIVSTKFFIYIYTHTHWDQSSEYRCVPKIKPASLRVIFGSKPPL